MSSPDDYLRDFPIGNLTNWIHGQYDPRAAFEVYVAEAYASHPNDPVGFETAVALLFDRATAKSGDPPAWAQWNRRL
ncbi:MULTISPECIES: hypothetical protein [Lysobacter]|jgi:hypothetical protein|uniref:YozE SAM-like domain-containing protein n=1 Tax=Lysobacter gummosus TaxID=262324 RepID=A0ABY3XC61_9GAMM|nr:MULTISPECIES: hypothetical protein [Lysobacter]UJB20658.1 hypothetical protein L1A79_06175 [Lysobacter capsici]UJQ30228.1 hypothetical protein L2D09_08685 [Lysobacter gummosus]UNP28025.1 hypothetical protein MOV92_16150 [Lysobacter gummosus]